MRVNEVRDLLLEIDEDLRHLIAEAEQARSDSQEAICMAKWVHGRMPSLQEQVDAMVLKLDAEIDRAG